MTEKANLTEKHMWNINRLRNKGYSWTRVQKWMNGIFHLDHHPVTYMRKYKEWKVGRIEGRSESTQPCTSESPPEKPGLWERIKGFFG